LNLTFGQQLAAQAAQLDGLNAAIGQLQQANAQLSNDLAGQRAALLQATAANAQVIPVQGLDAYTGASGQLIANPNGSSGVLFVTGLPALEAGQVYQLWLTQGDAFIAAGIFSVDEAGSGFLEVNSAGAIGTYRGLGVSIEPVGGSQLPTSQMVMVGSIS
jgi:hypothetical protein